MRSIPNIEHTIKEGEDMCYIIVPEEIEKKQKVVDQYEIGAGKFKENTPDYVLKMHEEIIDFYKKETEGLM